MGEVVGDIAIAVVGLFLIAVSRWVADNFKIPGQYEGAARTMIKMGGVYDDYPSQLYRWAVTVLTGLVFLVVGVLGLITR